MTRFDLYRGGLLFMSTTDITEAFNMFKKWTTRGLDVKMRFVNCAKAAA